MSVITSVYGGRASIAFEESRHLYTVNVPALGIKNARQPSVTTILGMKDKSGALLPWAVGSMADKILALAVGDTIRRDELEAIVEHAKDNYRKKKDDAADIGSLAHRTLEKILLHRADLGPAPVLPLVSDQLLAPNLTPEMIESANNCVQAGIEFFDSHKIKLIAAESVRWSPTYGYLGMCDLIAEIDGELCVADFKTGKRAYPEYSLQCAAYQHAYTEEHGRKISARWIVNVGRDGELQISKHDNTTFEHDFETFLSLLKVYRWHITHQGAWSKPAPIVVGPLDEAIKNKEKAA